MSTKNNKAEQAANKAEQTTSTTAQSIEQATGATVQSTERVAEATAEVTTQLNTFGLMNITNQALYAGSSRLVDLERDAIGEARDFADKIAEIRRKQSSELHSVIRSEAFKKSGMTIEEYATKLALPIFFKAKSDGTMEFKKSIVSQMLTAGSVYNDPNAPESLKKLPYSVLGAMSVLNKSDQRKIAFDHINKRGIVISTQVEAKDFNTAIKESIGKGKRKDNATTNATNNTTSATNTTVQSTEQNADSAAPSEQLFNVYVFVDGAYKMAHKQVTNDVFKIATVIGGVNEWVKDLANVPNGVVTPMCPIDGAFYGAVIDSTGTAVSYKLTPTTDETIDLPPESVIKGLKQAVETFKSIGQIPDAHTMTILDVAESIGYGF